MDVVDEAVIFATKAHSGQVRKFSYIPYICHPMEVAAIIASMTNEKETIAAGLLHDTIEDCDVKPEEILEKFGPRVYALVLCETEDKYSHMSPEDSWKDRKEDTLMILKNTKDVSVKMMWLADKLSNIRSFYREYLKEGDAIWLRLHQKDKKMQQWYYETIAEYVSDLAGTPAYQEYVELVNKIFVQEVYNG